MRRSYYQTLLLFAVLSLVPMIACGKTAAHRTLEDNYNVGAAAEFIKQTEATPPPVKEPSAVKADSDAAGEGGRQTGAVPEQRRLVVYRGNLVVAHPKPEEAVSEAVKIGRRFGGYEQSLTTTEIVLRIPVDRFLEAVDAMAALGDLIDKAIEGRDVSQEYFDFNSRLKALEAAHERYLEMYKQAGRVEDMLAIEKEITRLESEIEQLKGQIRHLENLAALSTLRVQFVPPRVQPQPPMPKSPGLPIPWLSSLGTGMWSPNPQGNR